MKVEILGIVATIIVCLFGSGGVVMWVLNRWASKKDAGLKEIKEGIRIGLENDSVIFNALRKNNINGESEIQEKKMNEYFRKSFIK